MPANKRLKDAQDEVAAQKLWERFSDRLIKLAPKRRRGVPCYAKDEDDVVLSAFENFYRGAKEGRFAKLNWSLMNDLDLPKEQPEPSQASKAAPMRLSEEQLQFAKVLGMLFAEKWCHEYSTGRPAATSQPSVPTD